MLLSLLPHKLSPYWTEAAYCIIFWECVFVCSCSVSVPTALIKHNSSMVGFFFFFSWLHTINPYAVARCFSRWMHSQSVGNRISIRFNYKCLPYALCLLLRVTIWRQLGRRDNIRPLEPERIMPQSGQDGRIPPPQYCKKWLTTLNSYSPKHSHVSLSSDDFFFYKFWSLRMNADSYSIYQFPYLPFI